MKLFLFSTAVLVHTIIRTECSSSGSSSNVPNHWYPSLEGSPNLGLPEPHCPGSLRSGYFGGSKYDDRGGLMVEIRVLSDSEIAVSMFLRNATEIVFVEIPSIGYTLSQQTLSVNMPTCFIRLARIQNSGTRVKLFPGDMTATESVEYHELIPEFGNTSPDFRPAAILVSQNLIYSIVSLQRITSPIIDWNDFLHKELEPHGVTDLPPSLVTLLAQRVTPAKSGAYIYSNASALMGAIVLIAVMYL